MLRRTEEVLHRKSIGAVYLRNDLTTLVFLQLHADHIARCLHLFGLKALISSQTGHNQTVPLLLYLALEGTNESGQEYESTRIHYRTDSVVKLHQGL